MTLKNGEYNIIMTCRNEALSRKVIAKRVNDGKRFPNRDMNGSPIQSVFTEENKKLAKYEYAIITIAKTNIITM